MTGEWIGLSLGLLLLASFWRRGPEVIPHPLAEENSRLRAMNLELAERVYICSGLLSRCAERRVVKDSNKVQR